jgi:hypothetical protein
MIIWHRNWCGLKTYPEFRKSKSPMSASLPEPGTVPGRVPVPPDPFQTQLLSNLQEIITLLTLLRVPAPPRKIALALPIITRNGKIMANYQLANDVIADIMITTVNANGVLVPAPVGDVFTVVSSDPTKMAAVIGKMPSGPFVGVPSLHINALMKGPFTGLMATITDSSGLAADPALIDIVEDLTPKTITLDFVDAVLTPQPVPAV